MHCIDYTTYQINISTLQIGFNYGMVSLGVFRALGFHRKRWVQRGFICECIFIELITPV